MTLQRLVLWRHGETDYNAQTRMQGQSDASRLTPVGLGQAQRAAPVLAKAMPDVLVTSDLSRAADTAALLGDLLGQDPVVDVRLRETHLGEWQGLTHAEVDARWPGARARWREDPQWRPPGGERRVDVAARAAEVVDGLDAAGPASAVLCTHGGLVSGLTPLLLGLPESTWFTFAGLSNCHWTELERWQGRWRLRAHNTAAPL